MTCCAVHLSLQKLTPGSLAVHQDMLVDIPFSADLLTLQENRQATVDRHLLQAKAKRLSHNYQVCEQVLKKNVISLSDKTKPLFSGPFRILRTHTNGTCTIRLSPITTEGIDIRRLKPFFGLISYSWKGRVT